MIDDKLIEVDVINAQWPKKMGTGLCLPGRFLKIKTNLIIRWNRSENIFSTYILSEYQSCLNKWENIKWKKV